MTSPPSALSADEDLGATAVEYAFLIALIAAVIAVAVGNFGGFVATLFEAAQEGFPGG
ncbi:hypothetical protein ACLM5J_14995 [Nocardioides sp. Bht2]|uniref:hypothetical protein n=1 Tax=Nocardioides sp. Bht2 TaxID=3392297 RepID=UPI0039B45FE5